jgi:hypothetical protein
MVGFVTQQSNLSDARSFVARVLAIPDGDGFISFHNTFMPKTHKPGDKLPMGFGTVASDADDFVTKLAKELAKKGNCDFYACMGTQKDHREKPYSYVDRKSGKTISGMRYVADKSRPNIAKLKALYTDVDFKGGDHGYPSEADAESGIADFLVASNLPPPNVVVHTGGGFHIYWTMDRELPVDEWQVLADQLKDAINTHGLRCDNGVTADPSHVLRVPNTKNYKYDPPRPVKLHKFTENIYTPEMLGAVLAKYGNLTPRVTYWNDPELAAFKGAKSVLPFKSVDHMKQTMDEITGGITRFDPIDINRVECGFVKDSLAMGGSNLEGQTLWNYATLLSVFTMQGEAAAHAMSSQNSYYKHEDTEALFARKDRERDTGVGPPSCAAIQSAGCTNCATCPHLTIGQNPLTYLSKVAAPPPDMTYIPLPVDETWPDILPFGWQRDANNLIYKTKDNKAGDPADLYPSLSTVLTSGYLSIEGEAMLHFKAQIVPFWKPKAVSIKLRDLHSLKDLTNTFADNAIHLVPKVMQEFLMAWVEELKKSKRTFTMHPAFGWAEENGSIVGFAYAGKLYTPNGILVAKNDNPELTKQYSPHGDIKVWRAAAKMLTDTKRPGIDAILASAFAAPLVYFGSEAGLYFGVYSQDSGVGKTTAMRIAQSVWSRPSAMQRLTDTINAVQHKMGSLRHLPITWDELKGEKNLKAMAQMVFDVYSGREKDRMNGQSMENRTTGEWKTLLVTACNNSMSDYLNEIAKDNDAGFYRLFEIEVERLINGRLTLGEASDVQRLMDTNYGVAGEYYAQYIGVNFATIQERLGVWKAAWEQELAPQLEERLWFNVIVTLLAGAKLANHIGLTYIDVDALKTRLFNEIKAMRVTLVEAPLKMNNSVTITSILMSFIRENNSRMIVTNDIWRQPSAPPKSAITIQWPLPGTLPPQAVVGQLGQASRTLRISRKTLDAWLTKNGHSPATFKRELMRVFPGGVQYDPKKTVGAGTDGFHGVPESVYDFDLAKCPELKDMAHVTITTQNVVQFVKP